MGCDCVRFTNEEMQLSIVDSCWCFFASHGNPLTSRSHFLLFFLDSKLLCKNRRNSFGEREKNRESKRKWQGKQLAAEFLTF